MQFLNIIIPFLLLPFIAACASEHVRFPAAPEAVQTLPLTPPRYRKEPAPDSVLTSPERDFKSALDAYQAGRGETALLLCRQVMESYPNTPQYKRSLFLMERSLIQLDRSSEAAAAMLRVQNEYPELGDYAVFLMADYHAAKARYSEAAALYGQVIDRYPGSSLAVRAAFLRAQTLFASTAYPQAVEAYQVFLGENPDSEFAPAAGLGIGRAQTAEAHLMQAVRAYRDVWVKYPGNPNDQDVEKALAELKKGGAEVSEVSGAELYERGRNLFHASQYDKALEALSKFLDREPKTPNRPDVLFRIGVSLFNLGKRDEAAVILEKMVKKYPTDARTPEALYWTGKSYSKLGEGDRAIEAFRKLHDRFPDSEWADDALFLSGNIYREENDLKKALSFYGRLVREYPDSKFADSAIWWEGWVYYLAGDYKRAEQALQELVNRYPRSFLVNQARYWQGRIAEKRGDPARAVATYDRMLRKRPYTYYGYRAIERKARLGASDVASKADDTADIATSCVETTSIDDPLHTYDTDDGPPVWTEEARRILSTNHAFKKTLELMHLDMKKEAASELWYSLDRMPKKHGALIGLSKTFFELGDYYRSLMLVLSNYERYLEGPTAGVSDDLWLLAYPQGYWESIMSYAKKYKQDPYFIAAIIREESQFHTEALSPAGARGLMQVMPSTGAWAARLNRLSGFDQEKLFDYDTAINIGTWYVSQLMKRFRNDPLLVAAAYNAGPEAVVSWVSKNGYGRERDMFVELIPYPETRGYVKKVLRNYSEYKRIYERPLDVLPLTSTRLPDTIWTAGREAEKGTR